MHLKSTLHPQQEKPYKQSKMPSHKAAVRSRLSGKVMDSCHQGHQEKCYKERQAIKVSLYRETVVDLMVR